MLNNKKNRVKSIFDPEILKEIIDTINKQVTEKNITFKETMPESEKRGSKNYLSKIILFKPNKDLSDDAKSEWGTKIYSTMEELLRNHHKLFTNPLPHQLSFIILKMEKNKFSSANKLSIHQKSYYFLSDDVPVGTVGLRRMTIKHVLNAAKIELRKFTYKQQQKSLSISIVEENFSSNQDSDSVNEENFSSERDFSSDCFEDNDDSVYKSTQTINIIESINNNNNNNHVSNTTKELSKRKNSDYSLEQPYKKFKLSKNNNSNDKTLADDLGSIELKNLNFLASASQAIQSMIEFTKYNLELNKTIENCNTKIEGLKKTIKARDEKILSQELLISEHEKSIAELKKEIKEKNVVIQASESSTHFIIDDEVTQFNIQPIVGHSSKFFKQDHIPSNTTLPNFSEFIKGVDLTPSDRTKTSAEKPRLT